MAPTLVAAQALDATRIHGNAADAEEEPRDVVLFLPTVPLTFQSLEKDEAGDWKMGNALTMGAGATLVIGRAQTEAGARAQGGGLGLTNLQPWVLMGVALNAGMRTDADGDLVQSIAGSIFVGLSDIGVSFSKDLLSGDHWVGISVTADVLNNLVPSGFMCLRGCASNR